MPFIPRLLNLGVNTICKKQRILESVNTYSVIKSRLFRCVI